MTRVIPGWKILADHTYDSFPIFTVRRSTRRNERTGSEIDFVRIDGLDWVNMIAITEDQQVVLVRQYRHGSEEFTLELPGGCVEKSEDPAESGARELLEETGYEASELQPLGMLFPNPAMYSMRNFFFVARGVRKTSVQSLDPGEAIEVITVPMAELFEWVRIGRFNHGMGVAALGLLRLHESR